MWNTFWCLCVCVCVCVCVELDLKKKKERKEQQRRRTAPRTVEASRRPASTERPPWPPPTCSSKRFVSWFLERSAFVFWFVCFQPTDDCVTEFTEFFFVGFVFLFLAAAVVGRRCARRRPIFFLFGYFWILLPSFTEFCVGAGEFVFFFEFLEIGKKNLFFCQPGEKVKRPKNKIKRIFFPFFCKRPKNRRRNWTLATPNEKKNEKFFFFKKRKMAEPHVSHRFFLVGV